MRHTKIIATVGPASDSDDVLDALIAAGTDIFRLNFSHGTHESQSATYRRVRAAAGRASREVAILQDLGGPKIRTGVNAGRAPIKIAAGEALRIVTGDEPGRPGQISTTFAGLAASVRPGDRLLLADGLVELRVNATDGHAIDTTVLDGGEIGEHKGINAPGVTLPASAITEKDVADLRLGVQLGVDMIAVSFVQTAADMQRARHLVSEAGAPAMPIVAKLERPQAIEHLDEILEVSDAVMVARGDLGLEMPLERLPRAQKEITRAARLRGIPVIVATQVLESMTVEARPTRAEVNDAANAVDDGVDAIMLAGETAAGKYPSQAVHTLEAIIRDAETIPSLEPHSRRRLAQNDHAQALCEAACTLADLADAVAIVAVTRGGSTARRLSAIRPRAPIIAATEQELTARRLTLDWGVVPLRIDNGQNLDEANARIGAALVDRGLVPPGAAAVFVSISQDLARSDANYLKIQRL
jgi:pyruvate kinase